MTTQDLSTIALAGATAVLANSVEAESVIDLVGRLSSNDDNIRGDAWQQAGPAGAGAVGPAAALWTSPDFEVARSARRAVWNIVHHAGRPGAATEARAVEAALLPLLGHREAVVRREAVWMLSEIGGDDSVEPLAKLLSDRDVREDARCGLERLPGGRSVKALQDALETVPEEFRYAVAESLRKRGLKVEGYPSRKLAPTRS
jgi:HEAT repeat protein